jgi:hypothetical protein
MTISSRSTTVTIVHRITGMTRRVSRKIAKNPICDPTTIPHSHARQEGEYPAVRVEDFKRYSPTPKSA